MKKSKDYKRVKFSADVLREATDAFKRLTEEDDEPFYLELTVSLGEEEWKHDSVEEFFSDYRVCTEAHYSVWKSKKEDFSVSTLRNMTIVRVSLTTRPAIQEVFEVFEKYVEESRLPEPELKEEPTPKPTIFIGHGRSTQWRDLKDHLQDKHGYDIEAYETGARAGHTIRDILDRMSRRSTFAILVMTGEDETPDGKLRARQNVIHEAGLFQGRLGFDRAIVLLEEDTEEFSNLHGIDQIRFSKGNIKETFGEVLATIKREFPD